MSPGRSSGSQKRPLRGAVIRRGSAAWGCNHPSASFPSVGPRRRPHGSVSARGVVRIPLYGRRARIVHGDARLVVWGCGARLR
jgi:hypothetical protein